MTAKELANKLQILADAHPDDEVVIVTLDREFGIHSVEYTQAELGMSIVIYSDETA